jgi:hypothetical protein
MNPEETRTLIKSTENLNTSFLGYRESQLGIEENIELTDNYRLTHVLDTGPTGYGKTQILVHTALQDSMKGHGLCIKI